MSRNWQEARRRYAKEPPFPLLPTMDQLWPQRSFDPATDLDWLRDAADEMEATAVADFQRDQVRAMREFIAELGG